MIFRKHPVVGHNPAELHDYTFVWLAVDCDVVVLPLELIPDQQILFMIDTQTGTRGTFIRGNLQNVKGYADEWRVHQFTASPF